MAVTALVALGGCGGSSTTTHATHGAVIESPPPVVSPSIVKGFPADSSIAMVASDGSVGWVLTSGSDAAIWKLTPTEPAAKFLGLDSFASYQSASLGIAAWGSDLVVLAQRCTVGPNYGRCARDSGYVLLYDSTGKRVAAARLWHDQEAGGGGSSPTFVGPDGQNLWLKGPNKLYEIDAAGAVKHTIDVPGGSNPCLIHGTLYKVDYKLPSLQTDRNGHQTAHIEPGTKGPPATISLERWTGSSWSPVPDGETSDAGIAPNFACGAIGLWLVDGSRLAESWSSTGGWRAVTGSSGPSGTNMPSIASNGAAFRLGTDGSLQWLDPTTGNPRSTGLTLASTDLGAADPAKPPTLVHVDAGNASVFACADALTGAPGLPDSPGVRCGFAPMPS